MHHSTFPGSARALLVAIMSLAAVSAAGAQTATPVLSAVSAVQQPVVTAASPAAELASAPAVTSPVGAPVPANEAGVSRSVLVDVRPAGLTARSIQRSNSDSPSPLLKQENGNTRTNTALMVVGAAAIVLGAAVGDEAGTVLIITGAGIGLYGLYRLLN